MDRFAISSDVAKTLPNMLIVAVYATGINNVTPNTGVKEFGEVRTRAKSERHALIITWISPQRPVLMFTESATSKAIEELKPLPNAQSHPRIAYYRDTLKKTCNMASKKFPQSNESLYKRVLKSGEPLRAINPVVDFYNAVSIKYGVTAGAFDVQDLQALQNNAVELRFSREGDTFLAFDAAAGADAVSVPAGELGYSAGNVILTRQLAWRQSKQGLVSEASQAVFFMSEVLDEDKQGQAAPTELAEQVRAELADGLQQYFGVTSKSAILGAGAESLTMDF